MKASRKVWASVFLTAAGLSAISLAALVLSGDAGSTTSARLVSMAGLGVATGILGAVGLNRLLTGAHGDESVVAAPASYQHTVRLFAVLAVGLLAALFVRQLAVPPTFGEMGHYRAAAVEDARDFPLRHVGEPVCIECHEEQATLHDKDAHASVACETCHGPGATHAESEGETRVLTPQGKAFCLQCHRALAARPGPFPQVRVEDHYKFVGVADVQTSCTECHDPHEPLFMDRDLRQARLHPLVHRCRDCHVGRTRDDLVRPSTHPAIFECGYCHQVIQEDFKDRSHTRVRCTTCHLFLRESDFAGRIVRDADPRFCLLCHRQAEFRSDSAPPGIEWPDHLDDVAENDEDRKKRCIDCHRERIHRLQNGEPDEGS